MTPTLQTTLDDFINGTRSSYSLVRQIRFIMRHGCGDHSCEFHKPDGMGTNGGCRCWQLLEDVMQTLEAEIARLRAELQNTVTTAYHDEIVRDAMAERLAAVREAWEAGFNRGLREKQPDDRHRRGKDDERQTDTL